MVNNRRRGRTNKKSKKKTNRTINNLVNEVRNLKLNGGGRARRPRRNRRRGNGIPNAGIERRTGTAGGCVVFAGSDYIASEKITTTMPTGVPVVFQDLNPVQLHATHLAMQARGFEKYRYRTLQFRIVSHIPFTAGGGYIAGFDPDPLVGITSTNGRQQIMSTKGSISNGWSKNAVIRPRLSDNCWMYVDSLVQGTARDTSPGTFVVINDTAPTVEGTFMVEIKYVIEFAGPTIQSNLVGTDTDVVAREGDYVWAKRDKGTCHAVQSMLGDKWLADGKVYLVSPPLSGPLVNKPCKYAIRESDFGTTPKFVDVIFFNSYSDALAKTAGSECQATEAGKLRLARSIRFVPLN